MSFELAVQSAIYTRLNSQLGYNVYDSVPQQVDSSQGFPFVTIGEDTLNEWDTDEQNGADVTITIHTWSRYYGRKETKEMQGAIYTALHRQQTNLSYSGYLFVDCFFLSSESFLDTDGQTRHGVQTFRVIIREL